MAPIRRPWWSPQHRGRVAWTVHLVLLACFAVLALVAHGLRADGPDLWASEGLQGQQRLDGLLRAVSWIGSSPQDLAIYAALILAVGALGTRRDATFLLGAVLGATALYWVVKTLVRRPRPGDPHVHILSHLGTYSFPSGHVVTYVACYGFLAYLAWIRVRPPLARRGAVAACLALVVLVGPSRVYLGAHWASDVLGAYLLGGLWLSVVLRAYVASVARPTGPGPVSS